MTALLTLSIIAFGIGAYRALPVNDLPAVDYPVITVSVGYPGATPETMANNVATPLERQFMQIPGLELVTSQNTQGFSSFTLQFALSKNIDGAPPTCRPPSARPPAIFPSICPARRPLQNQSQRPAAHVHRPDQRFGDAGRSVPLCQHAGRRANHHSARRQPPCRSTARPGRANQEPIRRDGSPRHFHGRSRRRHPQRNQLPGRRPVRRPPQHASCSRKRAIGKRRAVQQSHHRQQQRPARYLRDVATASTAAGRTHPAHVLGARLPVPSATVVMAVSRQAGANAVEVASPFATSSPSSSRSFRPSVKLTPIYDRSASIVNSVMDVQTTLTIAFVLVVMVISFSSAAPPTR
jgi:hydrophobic/amphiphilic exporter-1 (mainly G- bacteria), HAE1 family